MELMAKSMAEMQASLHFCISVGAGAMRGGSCAIFGCSAALHGWTSDSSGTAGEAQRPGRSARPGSGSGG
eukprot:1681751-Rhodomonas_salina.1